MYQVNCPPYLLLLDLYAEVDEAESVATVTPSGVQFALRKAVSAQWPQLCAVGDRKEIAARRAASIERSRQREAKLREEASKKKRQHDDEVFHKSWGLEKAERQAVRSWV